MGRNGLCIWITGLPHSGKTTLARKLAGGFEYPVLLDGDSVRDLLWPDLGYERTEKIANMRRIGFIAKKVVEAGGVCICSLVSPFEDVREEIRSNICMVGGFLLFYVDTPMEICQARFGKEIVPIYEIPKKPDVIVKGY